MRPSRMFLVSVRSSPPLNPLKLVTTAKSSSLSLAMTGMWRKEPSHLLEHLISAAPLAPCLVVKPYPWLWERYRSEEHTSELQSRFDLVCRLLLEKKKIH